MKNYDAVNEKLHNKLHEDIFPSNWVNPQSEGVYDLVVIGGGPGGMTAATIAKSFNVRVALVEKEHFGGECLSYGCIPSKAFLRSSRLAHAVANSSIYGVDIATGWDIDFGAVMERVYRLQATISPHDSAVHFKKLGIDVFLGIGHFSGPNALEVGNQIINFKKALIITGTQPILLNIPGLSPSDYWTNQNIFNISSVPSRFAFLGGGPIGCELAQAFARFGSQVTIITHGASLLSKEDAIASDRLQRVFEKEGIKIITRSQLQRVEKKGKEKILYLDSSKEGIAVDELFAGIGRTPAVEDLTLEKAGVSYDKRKGIGANEYLQTSNPNIYAAGDVTSPYKFTHVSKELAKIAVINALKGNLESVSPLIISWCTYTDPEVASIGMSEEEAKKQGIAIEVVLVEMSEIDRAILDGETLGFVKLVVKENSNQIVGGTIMAPHAGDMIAELSVAMNSESGLSALLKAIHPFPTQAQVLRTAAERLLANRKARASQASEHLEAAASR